jgi:MFS family permease
VLDATVVNVALPRIDTDLGFGPASLSWVLNAYTLAFGGLLLLYVWLLLTIKHREGQPHETARAARQPARVKTPVTAVPRYVVDGMSGWARPTFNGLGSVGEGDRVHVVVRPAGDMAGA